MSGESDGPPTAVVPKNVPERVVVSLNSRGAEPNSIEMHAMEEGNAPGPSNAEEPQEPYDREWKLNWSCKTRLIGAVIVFATYMAFLGILFLVGPEFKKDPRWAVGGFGITEFLLLMLCRKE